MLFKDLSIEAMDSVIAKYRDPNNPTLLDLDEYVYHFTKDGELIEQPEVLDMFNKVVNVGDVVVFPYTCGNSYIVHCGRVVEFKFLKKNGEPRVDPRVVVKWPDEDILITRGLHGAQYHFKRNKTISMQRIKNELVNVTKLL